MSTLKCGGDLDWDNGTPLPTACPFPRAGDSFPFRRHMGTDRSPSRGEDLQALGISQGLADLGLEVEQWMIGPVPPVALSRRVWRRR